MIRSRWMLRATLGIFIISLLISCDSKLEHDLAFESMSSDRSGITFQNTLTYTEQFNTYTYRNFYNGAGVALGDINNDGLLDIYFAGNQVENKLYLNKGNFTFEDITGKAGVACANVWSTGVSMADINGDGWLDIFVCKSGPPFGGVRHNELFINNGDLTFTESSREWGVADEGLSIHAVFFDYDNDGDLDFYLLNNSNRSIGVFDLKEGLRDVRDPFGGNKLYRNDGGRFTDVSEQAGIYGSAIGFGLGVTVADVNRDGWQDIFVSNDFFERDYLYINNGDGTFTESLESTITESSLGSMGADIADLNNDTYPEIYVTEMLPESRERVRTKTIFEDWDKYTANVKGGYHHQFTRNVLQLNNGPTEKGAKTISFSEIGRFSNVHATDWSWGALIFDCNNDGLKDVFVANGIGKDLTDLDYINFDASAILATNSLRKDSVLLKTLIDTIPTVSLANYMFINQGELQFANRATELGLDFSGFSNGAAYGDLDNDGSLDLVVSNINAPASVYRNNLAKKNNYLQIQIRGSSKNTFGIGTQFIAYCGADLFYAEHAPVRGYLSTVDHRVHIGLGKHALIDSLQIIWPGGSITMLKEIKSNQLIELNENSLSKSKPAPPLNQDSFFRAQPLFNNVVHRGNRFVDFNRDRLLFEMISNEGPALAVADVNHDGLEDIFVGGGTGQPGKILLQQKDDSYKSVANNSFLEDSTSYDVCALFVDVNNDGHLDLYVGSGGNQYSFGAPQYTDRLYVNDGTGKFSKAKGILQTSDLTESTSFVKALDFNKDGYSDLVVGSRLIPFYYGFPANVYLLQNDGKGRFTDVTREKAKDFLEIGLTKDAVVFDFDQDGDLDIGIVGEWMGIRVFENVKGEFVDATNKLGLSGQEGLWNSVAIGDFNGDGYLDFVAGNCGLNTKYRASADEPLVLYVNDFDGNGSPEQIICLRKDGKDYPLAQLSDLWKQMPSLKKKFQRYEQFKSADITDLFSEEILQRGIVLKVEVLESSIFLNRGGSGFDRVPLPMQAQFSKMYAVLPLDFNDDGTMDLLLGGNQLHAKPEYGIQHAAYGILLKGNGKGNFEWVPYSHAGIYMRGEVRKMERLNLAETWGVLIARHNEALTLFARNKK